MIIESGLSASLVLAHPSQCGSIRLAGRETVSWELRATCLPGSAWDQLLSTSLVQSWVSIETATVSIGYPQGLHSVLAWWAGHVEPNGRVPTGSKQKVVCDPMKCKSTRKASWGSKLSEASQVTGGSVGQGHQKPAISLTWHHCLWNTEHTVFLYLCLCVIT